MKQMKPQTVALKTDGNGTELILQSFPFVAWFICITNFFQVIKYSASPQFLTSVFDAPSWPILIFFASLEYFFILCLWNQKFFLIGNLIAYLKVNSDVLVKLMKT